MLATAGDPIHNPDDWVHEYKLDGWRGLLWNDENGDVHTYGGRNGSDYSGKLLDAEMVVGQLPRDTCVDGEIVANIDGDDWGSVQSQMTSHSVAHGLHYVVFDILRCDGTDVRTLPWTERRAMLESGLNVGTEVSLSQARPATTRAHQAAVLAGYEGSVFKRVDSLYGPGRSTNWIKVKPVQTCECEVYDFEVGTGRNGSSLGALKIRMDSGAVAKVGTGFDDALREEIWKHPEQWQGVVIEIQHDGLHPVSGKPRNPRFLRRRDDKMPAVNAPRIPASSPSNPGPPRARPATRGWRRNYRAMNDAKLQGCLAELELGRGDAADRVRTKGGDMQDNLNEAWAAAVAKGLRTGAVPPTKAP
jgi:bifunctional non-homologous end joining protein LigD